MSADTNQKLLVDYNDVFADIVNVLLFDGEDEIKEEGLENSKDRSQYKADGKLHEQERDVSKFYNGQEFRIAFLGLEHQNKRDSLMPARVISYDGSIYKAQINERLERSRMSARRRAELPKLPKKLYPVITVVLYFGKTHWKKGRRLSDILDVPKKYRKYVNDYEVNLIEVAFLEPEQIAMFQSDFRLVADYFRQRRIHNGEYIPPEGTIEHVDAVLKLLYAMEKDNRFLEILESFNDEEEKNRRNYAMCEVLDRIEERGIQKGIQQGIQQGIEQGIQQERVHTEEQRKRAEAAEKELEILRKKLSLA